MSDRMNYNPDHCAALDCTQFARNVLFCAKHAAMVPTNIGDAMRKEKLEGREHGPVRMMLMQAAIQAIAAREGRKFYKLPEFHAPT